MLEYTWLPGPNGVVSTIVEHTPQYPAGYGYEYRQAIPRVHNFLLKVAPSNGVFVWSVKNVTGGISGTTEGTGNEADQLTAQLSAERAMGFVAARPAPWQ